MTAGPTRTPSANRASSRSALDAGRFRGIHQSVRLRQLQRHDRREEEAGAEAEQDEAGIDESAVVIEDPDGQKSEAEQRDHDARSESTDDAVARVQRGGDFDAGDEPLPGRRLQELDELL